jgi:sulfonate transport system ATP-binding protein
MTIPEADAMPGRIELRDVAVSFPVGRDGRLVALDGLDLVVEPGELLALIGPNGSGKSTLLRVIGGLLAPDHGAALLDGRPIDGPDAKVGLVFQEPRLLPWRTTEANVAYPLELAGRPPAEIRGRVADLLRAMRLEGAANQVPSQLSGGMRQRAALARTLALEPEVLLLDEPFSALDALTRIDMHHLVIQLWRHHAMAVLLVTHDVDEALALADRVVLMEGGRLAHTWRVSLARPDRTPSQPEIAGARAEILAALGVKPLEPNPNRRSLTDQGAA